MTCLPILFGILTIPFAVFDLTDARKLGEPLRHGQPVVYTTSATEESKLLAVMQPYITMLEAVLEQYFKSDDEASVLFKLLGTLGRHVIVKNDVAEVRPALVKESVSFMREYDKFAHWLSDNYNDNSLRPIAEIMNKIFAHRFGRRMKIIEHEMKRLGQGEAWDELLRFWNTVNATDTEKLFAMRPEQLKSLDKFLDRTKSMALEHKSFELLYQTQVVEALADLARSMTTRKQNQEQMHNAKKVMNSGLQARRSSALAMSEPSSAGQPKPAIHQNHDAQSHHREQEVEGIPPIGESHVQPSHMMEEQPTAYGMLPTCTFKPPPYKRSPDPKEIEEEKKREKENKDKNNEEKAKKSVKPDNKKKDKKKNDGGEDSGKKDKKEKSKEKASKESEKKKAAKKN